MRRVKTKVPMEECKSRAIAFLRTQSIFCKASGVAYAIWPDATFRAQGAGAAASRILKALEKDGLVRWTSDGRQWGYELTRKAKIQ